MSHEVALGSIVIAYWDQRNYAFKGRIIDKCSGGKWKVLYDDGDLKCAPKNEVFKL